MVIVNVHVVRLFPPLEHAPDQIASRPVETLSVISVPEANADTAVLPAATLIRAGLDMIREPLRPETVTESVTVARAGGVGCSANVFTATTSDSTATPAWPIKTENAWNDLVIETAL